MSDALAALSAWSIEAGLLCTAVLVAPVLALRRPAAWRGHRAPALALHRAQREALERDRAAGLLGAAEGREAELEIDRRLLAEASTPDAPGAVDPPMRARSIALLLAPVPCAALVLYVIGGHPFLPAQPLANRILADDAEQRRDRQLVDALRETLARQDPDAASTRQGYLLLGQTEAARGDWAEAASAWRVVLARGGFDPVIAVQAAEAQTRADGRVGAEAAALFRRALAEGSRDAPWRSLAEQRIAQFEHDQDPH